MIKAGKAKDLFDIGFLKFGISARIVGCDIMTFPFVSKTRLFNAYSFEDPFRPLK